MRIVADMHTHSVASTHAYSTITEIAGEGAEKGLRAVAITDHGCAIPDGPHIWHFDNMRVMPSEICGIRVFRGVEANVLSPEGDIDIPVYALERLEWVVASMHKQTFLETEREAVTQAWMNIAQNSFVDVIGHSGTPEYAYDFETVIKEMGRVGKMVEINNATFLIRKESRGNCVQIAKLCKKHGVYICVNTDAHYHASVGNVSLASQMLDEIDFPEELIMNADYNRLLGYMDQRKRSS